MAMMMVEGHGGRMSAKSLPQRRWAGRDDARRTLAGDTGRARGGALCFRSWIAYVRPTIMTAITILVAVAVAWPLQSTHVTFVVVLAILGAYAARVLSLLEDMLVDDELPQLLLERAAAEIVGCPMAQRALHAGRTAHSLVANLVHGRRPEPHHFARDRDQAPGARRYRGRAHQQPAADASTRRKMRGPCMSSCETSERGS